MSQFQSLSENQREGPPSPPDIEMKLDDQPQQPTPSPTPSAGQVQIKSAQPPADIPHEGESSLSTVSDSVARDILTVMCSLYQDINRAANSAFGAELAKTAVSEVIKMALPAEEPTFSLATGRIRYVQFAKEHGWMLLSICAYSSSFCHACAQWDEPAWDRLNKLIQEDQLSIEMFANTRGLDWQSLLRIADVSNLSFPSQTTEADSSHLAPAPNSRLGERLDSLLRIDHPHMVFLTTSGEVGRPNFRGEPQINVDESFWTDESSDYAKADPTRRREGDRSCLSCGSGGELEIPCDCTLQDVRRNYELFSGDLVELRQYPTRGVGVRAVQRFRPDDFLGEYVGELLEPNHHSRPGDYLLLLDGDSLERANGGIVADVDSAVFGNWTRFINHSCNPSTEFRSVTIGDRVCIGVFANRDIDIFEELTISYGPAYFRDLTCLCGAPDCLEHKKPKRRAIPLRGLRPVWLPSRPKHAKDRRPDGSTDDEDESAEDGWEIADDEDESAEDHGESIELLPT